MESTVQTADQGLVILRLVVVQGQIVGISNEGFFQIERNFLDPEKATNSEEVQNHPDPSFGDVVVEQEGEDEDDAHNAEK